jgi:hypothetical protein
MTIPEILEFILLPAVGWLLMNSNANQRRLTRIETLLETFLQDHKHKNENN